MDVGSSTTKRPLLDLDPDYEDGHVSETKRRCLVEENGQEQAQQRVVEVVVRELDAALAQKENEALQLQERVQACQRALHLLRFGITSAYYRNFIPCDAPGTSARNEEQNPVHPAVLRLMGISLATGPKTRGVRYKSLTQGTSQEVVEGVSAAKISKESRQDEEKQKENEKEKQEERNEPAPIKVPRYVPPNLPKPPEVCAASARMERHRIKRRLVVGNVSKWLPEDLRESAATHKWMLYLRGPKDSPDISDIVAKVRYFLHPSYRPHDIVDVAHPFYLARRGWGEFPVRVQVHFTLQGNRPIDIIHNLKLDRTYSGLQTLGGETVVDVWLKQVSNHSIEESNEGSGSSQEESQQALDTLPESSNGDSDWHETVAHSKQELMVATIQPKTEAEEEAEDENREEMDAEEENEREEKEEEKEEEDDDIDDDDEDDDDDDDDENNDSEEEEDQVEDEEGVKKEKLDRIQKFQCDSKETVNDNILEHITSPLEHHLETIQVKSEADEIQNYRDNTVEVAVAETSKVYVASSEKRFVIHTLPDHDYLGSETFKLKCTLCVEQNNSDGFRVRNPLKAQTMQATNQSKEPCWSSSVPPPLVLIQKSQEKSHVFPLNSVVSSDNRQMVKKEEIKDATKMDCVVSVPRNGFISNSSLVQCVDAEGNLFYINLQKPTFSAKCGIQKDMLNSSFDIQKQHLTVSTVLNHVLNSSFEGKKGTKNNIVFQKNMGIASTATLQTGRSLLKKNCVTPLPPVPSETNKLSSLDKHIKRKPIFLGSTQLRVNVEPEESNSLLKEAEHIVSRIADDQQAVIWILQQLPLADKHVNNPEFRRQHPYCAKNVDEFLSWPVGKRHCAERLRANAVHAILQKTDSSRFAKWSVRHIMKWSRLHALTPLPSVKKEHKEVENPPAINSSSISTVTEPSEVRDWLENMAEASKTTEEMEIVNVDELIQPSPDSMIPPCSEETSNAKMWIHSDTFFDEFLRDTVAQLDIKLKPEILCPDVMYSAAEEVLNKACQSLCEDLLRRSMCQAWDRCKEVPNEIVLVDVQNAILSRPEFNVFTNDGLGVQAYDPFKYS